MCVVVNVLRENRNPHFNYSVHNRWPSLAPFAVSYNFLHFHTIEAKYDSNNPTNQLYVYEMKLKREKKGRESSWTCICLRLRHTFGNYTCLFLSFFLVISSHQQLMVYLYNFHIISFFSHPAFYLRIMMFITSIWVWVWVMLCNFPIYVHLSTVIPYWFCLQAHNFHMYVDNNEETFTSVFTLSSHAGVCSFVSSLRAFNVRFVRFTSSRWL